MSHKPPTHYELANAQDIIISAVLVYFAHGTCSYITSYQVLLAAPVLVKPCKATIEQH